MIEDCCGYSTLNLYELLVDLSNIEIQITKSRSLYMHVFPMHIACFDPELIFRISLCNLRFQ